MALIAIIPAYPIFDSLTFFDAYGRSASKFLEYFLTTFYALCVAPYLIMKIREKMDNRQQND